MKKLNIQNINAKSLCCILLGFKIEAIGIAKDEGPFFFAIG